MLVAHPALERSRVHRRLLASLPGLEGVTVHDLYGQYPAFDIDVHREQALLAAHDVLVVQHPLFWYSTPAIVKQWEDVVLERGWAYGRGGTALAGKAWFHALSAGSREAAYQPDGHQRLTIRELLAPLEQTARACHMTWLPPYVIHGTEHMDEPMIERAAAAYADLLSRLHDQSIDLEAAQRYSTFNAALEAATS